MWIKMSCGTLINTDNLTHINAYPHTVSGENIPLYAKDIEILKEKILSGADGHTRGDRPEDILPPRVTPKDTQPAEGGDISPKDTQTDPQGSAPKENPNGCAKTDGGPKDTSTGIDPRDLYDMKDLLQLVRNTSRKTNGSLTFDYYKDSLFDNKLKELTDKYSV